MDQYTKADELYDHLHRKGWTEITIAEAQDMWRQFQPNYDKAWQQCVYLCIQKAADTKQETVE